MKRDETIMLIKNVIQKNKIKKAYLFGSFARGEPNFHDIDIAIEAPPNFSLLDLARVANVLEEKTGIKVDLITIKGINPMLRNSIVREMVAL